MWKRLRDWWRAEGDLVHLQGLDDRILADMGVERDGLRQRVMGRSDVVDTPLVASHATACACSSCDLLEPAEPPRNRRGVGDEGGGLRPLGQKIGPA
jgi:hypothetical protein